MKVFEVVWTGLVIAHKIFQSCNIILIRWKEIHAKITYHQHSHAFGLLILGACTMIAIDCVCVCVAVCCYLKIFKKLFCYSN